MAAAVNMQSTQPGPEFVRLFRPLLDALRDLGDSGRPKEVTENIAKRMKLPDEELNKTNRNGQSRFANQVAFARFYLAKAGLIDTSQRGVWTLTESGHSAQLNHVEALNVYNNVRQIFAQTQSEVALASASDEAQAPSEEDVHAGGNFVEAMTKTLQSLSPDGFERLCMRILREVGFEGVNVTRYSGDGGIDGYGTLRINELVSDRVVFQCKRYKNQVGPSDIREFRGSMAARTDRGIFLTTSSFSVEARREAAREGLAPIELVDLDGLISLLKRLKLGVTPREVYDIDETFFREYMPTQDKDKSNGPA
jgi:restriction system protein